MRKIALLGFSAVVALSFAGAAVAADDTMSVTYGNTVLVTNAKGEVTKLWFKADGTYAAEGPTGQKGTGKWAIKNGQYCSTPDLPANVPAGTPAPKETCGDYKPGHKVGDKWSQNDGMGQPITVEIKAGM